MFESKYGKVLTIILIVVIIAIVGLLGFLGFDFFRQYFTTKEASDFVENFQGDKTGSENTINQNQTEENEANGDALNEIQSTPDSSSGNGSSNKQYKGFTAVGTMTIPSIKFEYPVLEKVTPKSIETAVAVLYPKGDHLNQVGNTVIIGHNYRNGLFFSNLKKVAVGDKIYVTDSSGKKLTYTIYNKFETSDTDTSFYDRDTQGKAELTLSTCTDASNDRRLIVLAKEI